MLVLWEKGIGWRKREGKEDWEMLLSVLPKCREEDCCLVLSHPCTFPCLAARQPSFASPPAHLAACWRGGKGSCSYRSERAPMQNGSGATGIAFNYPLFRHGRHLIPVHFGRERRKMNSSFSDWCLH